MGRGGSKAKPWGKSKAKGQAEGTSACGPAAPAADAPTKRREAPPVYNKTRGDKQVGLETARNFEAMDEAMSKYMEDWTSAGDTSQSYIKSWHDFHEAHWDGLLRPALEALPLTPQKIHVVGALLKLSGYRSAKIYLSAIKKLHYEMDEPWSTALELAERRFLASVQRGMPPPRAKVSHCST